MSAKEHNCNCKRQNELLLCTFWILIEIIRHYLIEIRYYRYQPMDYIAIASSNEKRKRENEKALTHDCQLITPTQQEGLIYKITKGA